MKIKCDKTGLRISILVYLLLFALVFLAAIPIKAKADQIPCIDTLAAAQYGQELRHIPLNYGIRGFAKKEFGDFYPVAVSRLESGGRWVGVNLLWSDTHQFGDKDIPFIKKEAARYEPLCQKYKGKIELSPFTEHNLKIGRAHV